MNVFFFGRGGLHCFCSRASSSVLTCVCMCMSRYWQAMGTSLRVCQIGQGSGGGRGGSEDGAGGGQRDDKEEGEEEMGSFP